MTQESKLYNYLASDKDYVASIDNPDTIKFKSKIMLPLMDGEQFIGIVTAYNSIKKVKKFTKKDVELLQKLSPYLINALYKIHQPNNTQHCNTQQDSHHIESNNNVQEELENNEDTLTFVSNFVHDIRTPANTLYGFLDILESQITDERLKTYLLNAKESASFINELTTSVLNMVSTHKESCASNIQEVNSIKFFSSVAKSFASNMYAKDIKFNIYIDPLIPKNMKLDTLKIKRVLLNLIGNAYKFTPNHKTIEFSLRYITKTNRIAIYVKDTGIGIPKEKQKTIFEAFKQAEETTALHYGGTGLGLFISAKYVKELGGTLALISEIDKGSTFSFDIPAHITDDAPSYEPLYNTNSKIAIIMDANNSFSANNIARYAVRMGLQKEQIVALQSVEEVDEEITHILVFQKKITTNSLEKLVHKRVKILIIEEDFLSIEKDDLCESCDVISQYGYIANKLYQFLKTQEVPRVLIVDDDHVSIVLIETILENEFCETTVAKNGKEALELMREAHKHHQPFHIVYIDHNMPIMNGTDAMRAMREYERDNGLQPIYAASTSGDQLVSPEEKKLFDCYLGKPFKKEQIRDVLATKSHTKEKE
jgi:signal transduction histidine kinase/CheY-like chemotaxis protein